MSDAEYICNLPGLMMSKHRLTEGAVEIYEDSGKVVLELWNGRTSTMDLEGKEDAEVLRYVAHCLDHFAELRKDEEEAIPAPAPEGLSPTPPTLDQAATKKPQIVAGPGATPELNAFALK